MVAWLRSPEGQHLFASKFSTEISLASRPFSVLIKYIPIALEVENPNTHRDIERRNNLPTSSIHSACWIKPVERHSPNQCCAHTIFDFFSPGGANHIIQNHLIVLGKRCPTCKLLPEPTRCMKCQSFTGSHFTKECKSDHNMCGTCAGKHQTRDCMASLPEGLQCTNCKQAGHTAWDRDCPIFINLCQCFHANYRFYPESNNPSTWECTPGPDHSQPETWWPMGARHAPQPHPMFTCKDGWKTIEQRRNTTSDWHKPTTQPN